VCVPPSVLSAAPTPGNLRFGGIAFLLQINYPRPLPLFYPPLPFPSNPLPILTACPSRSPPGRLCHRHSHAYLAATRSSPPAAVATSAALFAAHSQRLKPRPALPQLPLWPPEPDPLRASCHAISRLGPTAGPHPRLGPDCPGEALCLHRRTAWPARVAFVAISRGASHDCEPPVTSHGWQVCVAAWRPCWDGVVTRRLLG